MTATTTIPTTPQPESSGTRANGHQLENAPAGPPPAAPPPRARKRTILIIVGIVVAVFVAFLVLGIVYRSKHSGALAAGAAQAARTPPQVYVVRPAAAATGHWPFPATTQALQDAGVDSRLRG